MRRAAAVHLHAGALCARSSYLLFGMSFLFPFGAPARARMRAELPWVGVFAGVAGLVAAPILIHFALHPEHFFMRSNQVSIFGSQAVVRQAGAWLVALGQRVGSSPGLWFSRRPKLAAQFPGPAHAEPMGQAFFFWLGVGDEPCWRWQRPALSSAASLAGRSLPAGRCCLETISRPPLSCD